MRLGYQVLLMVLYRATASCDRVPAGFRPEAGNPVQIDDPLFGVGADCLPKESLETVTWSGLDLLSWQQRRSARLARANRMGTISDGNS
jgi:hypothetical protein